MNPFFIAAKWRDLQLKNVGLSLILHLDPQVELLCVFLFVNSIKFIYIYGPSVKKVIFWTRSCYTSYNHNLKGSFFYKQVISWDYTYKPWKNTQVPVILINLNLSSSNSLYGNRFLIFFNWIRFNFFFKVTGKISWRSKIKFFIIFLKTCYPWCIYKMKYENKCLALSCSTNFWK